MLKYHIFWDVSDKLVDNPVKIDGRFKNLFENELKI